MAGFSQADRRYAPLPMTHEWLAEVAALVGAAGAVLVFLGRPHTGPARRRLRAARRCDGHARRGAAAERRPRTAGLGQGSRGARGGCIASRPAVRGRSCAGRPSCPSHCCSRRRSACPSSLAARTRSCCCRCTSCSPPPRWRCSTAPSAARSWPRSRSGSPRRALPSSAGHRCRCSGPSTRRRDRSRCSSSSSRSPRCSRSSRDRRMRPGCRGRLPSASSAWLPSSPRSVSTRRGRTRSSSPRTCASPTRTRRTSASRPSSRTRASTAASWCSR